VLATAPELDHGDFAEFHARARQLVAQLSASNYRPDRPDRAATAQHADALRRAFAAPSRHRIAREIVQRLGGKIGFVDAPGGGAIFHVALPVVESAAAVAFDVSDGARADRERARLASPEPAVT
jgi:hypothetical protein